MLTPMGTQVSKYPGKTFKNFVPRKVLRLGHKTLGEYSRRESERERERE